MSHELVTVKKTGQPTLRISKTALAEHVKLGWRHVEDEPVAKIADAITGKPDLKKDDDKKPLGLNK